VIGRLATRQHGVVSNGQLRGLGLDREAVRRRVASGYLHRVHHGVFAVGHRSLTLHGSYAAAVLAGGPRAALSHRAAADLWQLGALVGRITITVPHDRGGLPTALRIHRSRMFHPGDFTQRHGIPVTTVARTLLDLAGVASRRELARVVDTAERLELFDLTAVEGVLARARGRRGAAALRCAIAGWQPRHTRSELEDRFAELVARSALPPPDLNVLLDGELSQHEVDAFWPSQRLAVQLDGFAFHRTRRDRERDAATDADLELAGLRVVRLTWDEVTRHADRTLRRLAVIFGGR
jgi:very-short-patch-repair endonuclease